MGVKLRPISILDLGDMEATGSRSAVAAGVINLTARRWASSVIVCGAQLRHGYSDWQWHWRLGGRTIADAPRLSLHHSARPGYTAKWCWLGRDSGATFWYQAKKKLRKPIFRSTPRTQRKN